MKRRINRLLKEEKDDKLRGVDDHQHDVGSKTGFNQKIMADLKKLLTTFDEVKERDAAEGSD